MRKENHHSIKKILIISEDKESFLIYLRMILTENRFGCSNKKRKIKQSTSEIYTKVDGRNKTEITIKHIGSCPEFIANHAKKEHDNYDKIFCVFDLPSSQSGHKRNFKNAINLIDKYKKINAITSAPCYEFWLFIHFVDSTSPISWDELKKNLNKAISKDLGKEFEYEKNKIPKDLLETLLNKQDKAFERAARMERINQKDDKKSEEQIPHTKIHHLIKEIIK